MENSTESRIDFAQVLVIEHSGFESRDFPANLFRGQRNNAIGCEVALRANAQAPLVVGQAMKSKAGGKMPPESLAFPRLLPLFFPSHLATLCLTVQRLRYQRDSFWNSGLCTAAVTTA